MSPPHLIGRGRLLTLASFFCVSVGVMDITQIPVAHFRLNVRASTAYGEGGGYIHFTLRKTNDMQF